MYWKYGTILRLKKPWHIGSIRQDTDVDLVLLKTLGGFVEVVTKNKFLEKKDFLTGRKRISVRYLHKLFPKQIGVLRPTQLYDPELKKKGFEYLL
jgi:hypothetical protein